MGKRFGPLHATEQGVLIGDPTRRHLLLAEDGIHHADGEKRLATFAWDRVENVRLGYSTTWFPWPGAVAGVLWAAAVALAQDDLGVAVDDGKAEVATRDGVEVVDVSRHHLGPYWKSAVARTEMLVEWLAAKPERRTLLSAPDELVRRAARRQARIA
jgi:hypothetical protein